MQTTKPRHSTRARVAFLERVADAADQASMYNRWERMPIRAMSATTINTLLDVLDDLKNFDVEQGLKKCSKK